LTDENHSQNCGAAIVSKSQSHSVSSAATTMWASAEEDSCMCRSIKTIDPTLENLQHGENVFK